MLISRSTIQKIALAVVLIFSFSLSSLAPVKVAADADHSDPNVPVTICLPSVPRLDNFPDIALDFRALNSDHNTVANLSSSDIQAQENSSTPIPVTLSNAPEGAGINLYFVVDIGNRTDPALVASTLKTFASSMLHDKVDNMTIITDDSSSNRNVLDTTSSLDDFNKAVQNFPAGNGAWNTINSALDQALKDIKGQAYGCSRSNLIIVLAGKNTLDYGGTQDADNIRYQGYIDNATATWTKLDFFYYAQPGSDSNEEGHFTKLAQGTHGLFRTITNAADIQASLPLLNFDGERALFTGTYRTNNSESDNRNVSLLYQGNNITFQPQAYSVTVASPIITITSPVDGAVIQLPVIGSNDTSKDAVDVEFSVDWPDGHPRKINSASLVVTSPGGTTTDMTIPAGVPLKFNWNIGKYRKQNAGSLSIKVTATDEFNITATSKADAIKFNYASPNSVLPQKTTDWLLYILYAVVAILLILLIVMSRRIKTLASSGAIRRAIEQVRKTIVGGRARKDKPLAVLKVLDGPASLVNQDLNIYSESVKLGRDPEKADLIFFTPEAKTSISGLHCRIERKDGTWRIIALSASGSETFVDNQAIPFNEPYSLLSGQTVRLGYLAQQPVVFQFIGEQSSEQANEGAAENDTKPDDVAGKAESKIENYETDERENEDARKTRVKVPDVEGNIASSELLDAPKKGEDDDLFAEFREK